MRRVHRFHRVVARLGTTAIAVLALAPFGAPAGANTYTTTSVVQASGPSPFAGCDISGQSIGDTNYVNTELEPFVAVNPSDPTNVIGVWQQDRWSGGAARGLVAGVSHDGGQNWNESWAHFSVCSGGTAANGGNYERASDPWVSISPNGVAYQISLSLNFVNDPASAVLVSRSTNGGDSWGQPVTLVRNRSDVAPFLFNDKESITADPLDSNYAYAVWDRSRHPSDRAGFNAQHSWAFRGDIIFSRTTDGGQTWEPARAIFRPKSLLFSIGNVITVLPDGTLVDVFDNEHGSGKNAPGFDIQDIRSTDHGATWSQPREVAPEHAVAVRDPDTGFPVRAGAGLPDIATDLNPSSPGYGNLYAVWADSHGTGNGSETKTRYDRVVFTMSTDGGLTWSPLRVISKSPAGVQAFTPAVDVASDGTIGVTYYDFRNNTPAPGVPTDYWFIHCHPNTTCTSPANWSETHVSGGFDVENAPVSRGYFMGDYEGLAANGTSLGALFAHPSATDKDNTYFGTVSP